jgi:hypothetical protein
MPSKRALLIASTHGGLRGPRNDIARMESALNDCGFHVTKCSGNEAHRDKIMLALSQLVNDTGEQDTVVVYYSGHGGIVEGSMMQATEATSLDGASPWRRQFIVPEDFGSSGPGDFRGILDVELSSVLRAITEKTKNLTVILDCCHAGRIAREPGFGSDAVPKNIPKVEFSELSEHLKKLKEAGHINPLVYEEENPFMVSIAAARATETAWEHRNAQGEWCGVMTEVLASLISKSTASLIPWRTILFRVMDRVNVEFSSQHPYVAGPAYRLQFSLDENISEAFHIKASDKRFIINAGRVSGVHEGNVYGVKPLSATSFDKQLAKAVVTQATAFSAIAELNFGEFESNTLPEDGGMVYLQEYALPRWPVGLPPGLSWLDTLVQSSRFVRTQDPEESGFLLAQFSKELDNVVLHSNQGVRIISVPVEPSSAERQRVLAAVEQLSRAKHLMSLRNEEPEEFLIQDVQLELTVVSPLQRIVRLDGSDVLTEGERVCIKLTNQGPDKVYVYIFNINSSGVISRISHSKGIELPVGRMEDIGRSKKPTGLGMSWPEALNRSETLEETLLFVLTDSPVDLDHLANPPSEPPTIRSSLSNLQQLTWTISTGCSRDPKEPVDENVCYAARQIKYQLLPRNASGKGA